MIRDKRIVYKYKLDQETDQVVIVEKNPIVRAVDVQNGAIWVWVEVDSSEGPAPTVAIPFKMVCTGDTFDTTGLTYLDTLLINKGSLVVHVYYGE